MIKFKTVCISIILAAVLAAGCGRADSENPEQSPVNTADNTEAQESSGPDAEPTDAGPTDAEPADTEPVRLTISSADNNFGISKDPALQEAVINLLEEKAGVELTAIIPPLGNYIEKVETMVASGDIPDVMVVHQAMTRIPSYVYRGKLLALDDYISNSEKLSALPADTYDAIRVNGSVYHVPFEKPQVKILYMRKDVMEEYGIQLSNTPTIAEFMTELSKLKGTGIIPLSFPKWIDNFQFFMNSFGAYGGIYQNEEGVYVDGFQEPEMVAALEYICQLYQEGIIDQEFITAEIPATMEYVNTKKAAGVIDFVGNYTSYLSGSEAAGAYTDVFPIYALMGPEGEGGGLNIAIRTALTVSAECENPEQAVALIEALVCDPETYAAFKCLGVEGEHYTLDENQRVVPTETAKNTGYAPTYTYLYEAFAEDFSGIKAVPPQDIADSLDTQREIMTLAQQYKGPKYVVPSGLSDAYDQMSPSITSTWQEIVSQIVLGTVSVEQGMENYRAYWDSIDGDTMLKELNGQ